MSQTSYPPSPKQPSSTHNDESSLDDYEEALLEIGDDEVEYPHHLQTDCYTSRYTNNEPGLSSVTTADWEEAESFIASMANSESFPISTPASSSGTSPLTGLSSQGVSPGITNANEQAFPFSIPEDPDQTLSSISDVLQVEKDFMEFVKSFPHNVPSMPAELQPLVSPLARKSQSDSNAKVGLDHLDNLCKLMEQLSDLKETNVKLRRRIQYLEDIKTLQEIHKEMADERKLYSSGLSEDEIQQLKSKLEESEESEQSEDEIVEKDESLEVPSSEHLLGLYRSKTANQISEYKCERGHKSRSTIANKERRERSKSVGHSSHSKNKKRPSRWSKVKEVLGIEKNDELSATASDERQNVEPATEQGDKEKQNRKLSEHSKAYKLTGSKSHSNVLSSRSFSEAERQNTSTVLPIKKSGTLDSKTAQAAMENFEKEETAKKSPKTPWGKMKTMIQIRRDNRHQKSESSSSSPRDIKPNKSPILPTESTNGHSPSRRNQRANHRSPYAEGGVDTTTKNNSTHSNLSNEKSLQRLDIGYSNEHRYRQKSPHKYNSRKSSAPLLDTESKNMYEKGSPKSRQGELDCYMDMRETVVPKENCKRKKSKPRPPPLEYTDDATHNAENEEGDLPRSPGMSPSVQRKWVWTKVKDVLKGNKREDDSHFSLSAPSSPASAAEALTFDFDLEKTKEEENFSSAYQSPRVSDGGDNSLLLPTSNPSATVTELLRELQQNLSDDFNKKLEEWQRCRTEGIQKISGPEVERKDSFGRIRKISKPEKKLSTSEKLSKSSYHMPKKDLCWLEKEQQKIDREILRLSKEKQKFEKRSFRLKQLKEAMTDSEGQKKEVLVKTSAGEFRFEGISDAFTKKLYEWETKKGVNPELSTIALLDESLKPHIETVISTVGSNSTRTSPEPPKACFQVSRASSEPDLSTAQKDSSSNNQATRSKSGDTLLAGELDVVVNLESDIPLSVQQEHRDEVHHSEDNYYSLLEENMFLLDQLKDKEEICSHLQNELERLDDKSEKTNRIHQEEMEKYRQKLWEIHMSRPRDLQGSLHLISELKSRIEELQKCSDKLKSDRERLEESFRYHSNQQARLADDLIRKMREMQVTGTPLGITRSGNRRKWRKAVRCDPSTVTRIHDLSTQLLQQARDVEQTLMERTRQVCHLRWELLHRDMSAVLLQAALHRVTSQGEPVTILPTWDKRRNKFKNIKAWSVDTTTRRPSEDLVTDDWLQERLKQLSMTPYNDWANIDFSPNDLMTTAHELKKETLRLSISRQDRVTNSEEKKSATCSADSEMADSDRYYDTGSAVNSRSSSFSSGPGGLRGSHSDTRLYERTRALRRNSSSSMSCVEASDSSSLHDSDKMHFLLKRFPWRTQWRSLDNVSSSHSSRSSILDDEMNKWRPIRTSSRGAESMPQEELMHTQLQQKYGSFKETDEENEEPKVPTDWGSQCLITPRPIHLARISDNESDKNRYSPHPYSSQNAEAGVINSMTFYPTQAIPTTSYSRGKSYHRQEKVHSFPKQCKMLAKMEHGSLTHGNELSINTTDGSMESLDKYETAIRDEDLTVSDDQIEHFGHHHIGSIETFSDFEEDLKQRTSKLIHSNPHSGSSATHNCISNYTDKPKQSYASSSTIPEHDNSSVPGSPNISKFKYKGTKGFGRSSRVGYKNEDEKLKSVTDIDENGT